MLGARQHAHARIAKEVPYRRRALSNTVSNTVLVENYSHCNTAASAESKPVIVVACSQKANDLRRWVKLDVERAHGRVGTCCYPNTEEQ